MSLTIGAVVSIWLGSQPGLRSTTSDDFVYAALFDGRLARVAASEPWEADPGFAWIGPEPRVRSFGPLLIGLSGAEGTIRIISAVDGREIRKIELGEDASPRDIAVVSARRAYVTDGASGWLLRVDLVAGTAEPVVDLTPLADADGNPDLDRLHRVGETLFVQLGRWNRDDPRGYELPAMVAAIDLASESLLDADPDEPGDQAIELVGMAPKSRMTFDPASRKLLVSATGIQFDPGGIEAIDIDGLRSAGLLVAESDGRTGSDLGPFVVTAPGGGYLAFTTDLIASTHLHAFTFDGDVSKSGATLDVGVFANELAYDPARGLIWMPVGTSRGLVVVDAGTGELLTPDPIELGAYPMDLELHP